MYVCMYVCAAPLRRFGLESRMVFEGTRGVYECIYRFNSKCGAS